MFSQHVSCWCDRASPQLCDPLRLCPAWAHSALFLTQCLLCFSLLEFWGFLTSGSHTKPPRETQLKPPGFICFHNKTRRWGRVCVGKVWGPLEELSQHFMWLRAQRVPVLPAGTHSLVPFSQVQGAGVLGHRDVAPEQPLEKLLSMCRGHLCCT